MGQMLACHWKAVLLAWQRAAYAVLLLELRDPHTVLMPTTIAALLAMARLETRV